MAIETQTKTDSQGVRAGVGTHEPAGNQTGPADKTFVKPGRIVSLDVFRGMTIAGMILVNNSGGPSYGPLDHGEWNGWTHTDLIFPFFMFIAGASMALSFASRKSKPLTTENTESTEGIQAKGRTQLLWHVVRRGATIF